MMKQLMNMKMNGERKETEKVKTGGKKFFEHYQTSLNILERLFNVSYMLY